MLHDFHSPYDAACVEYLQDAGATVIGKTNMDEFGMGSYGVHSAAGATKNPHDHQRVAGGSSSGSAAAVASGMCRIALGSDTGGSIRLPAAYCNIFGFKPTYGSISRHGLVAYASSLDTVGIFATALHDLRHAFSVLSRHDHRDPASLQPKHRYPSKQPPTLRIGIPIEYFPHETPSSTITSISAYLHHLLTSDIKLVPVSLPHTAYALPAYYIITSAEAHSNLARYDGTRFGLDDHASAPSFIERITANRSHGFGPEVKRRILLGAHVLSQDAYQSYFLQAQKVRRLVQRDFQEAFHDVDLMLTPVTTGQPPSLIDDALTSSTASIDEYLNDVFTIPASLAGLPAITAPTHVTGCSMPLQFIAAHGHDHTLLNALQVFIEGTQ